MTKKEYLDEVREIELALVETGRKCDGLMKRTKQHLVHLAELIDDTFKYDSHVFRTEHEKLEDEVTAFLKYFRQNRKDVFVITEHVMESDKLAHLSRFWMEQK